MVGTVDDLSFGLHRFGSGHPLVSRTGPTVLPSVAAPTVRLGAEGEGLGEVVPDVSDTYVRTRLATVRCRRRRSLRISDGLIAGSSGVVWGRDVGALSSGPTEGRWTPPPERTVPGRDEERGRVGVGHGQGLSVTSSYRTPTSTPFLVPFPHPRSGRVPLTLVDPLGVRVSVGPDDDASRLVRLRGGRTLLPRTSPPTPSGTGGPRQVPTLEVVRVLSELPGESRPRTRGWWIQGSPHAHGRDFPSPVGHGTRREEEDPTGRRRRGRTSLVSLSRERGVGV